MCLGPALRGAPSGARTGTIIHLVNLAYWHDRTFDWDPKDWTFGNEAAWYVAGVTSRNR